MERNERVLHAMQTGRWVTKMVSLKLRASMEPFQIKLQYVEYLTCLSSKYFTSSVLPSTYSPVKLEAMAVAWRETLNLGQEAIP